MQSDLEVDTVALRAAVPPLLDLAADLAARSTRTPPAGTLPHWSTSDAATDLAAATRAATADLAEALAATAHQITAAATAYEAADDRSATRVRASR